MEKEEVIFLANKDIDRLRWDKCIESAHNGLIYGFSWYLDIVSDNWDALVNEDYSIVFPLTYNIKYGISYLVQPPFCQLLGIFSIEPLNKEIAELFLNSIPPKFKFAEINLNLFNNFEFPGFKEFKRLTYILDVNSGYDLLKKGFSENTLRNIKKADKNGIFVI